MTRSALLLALVACAPPREPVPETASACTEIAPRFTRCLDEAHGIACYTKGRPTRMADAISCVRIAPMPMASLENLGTEPKIGRRP